MRLGVGGVSGLSDEVVGAFGLEEEEVKSDERMVELLVVGGWGGGYSKVKRGRCLLCH